MTPERFERVRDIFLILRDLPASERDPRMIAECNGDTELRDLVSRLLTVDAAGADTLLDEPILRVANAFAEVAPEPRPTLTHLDKYRLIRLLGVGSIGDVFLAEQDTPIRRTVALKLLRPLAPASRNASRFAIEREALSKLSHQNIAGILDAGCGPDGRAYIVMELVPGERLDDHLRSRNPTTEQRLSLFLQLCAGVQHAHHRGVIHRDLKPANVLVVEQDGVATIKIVDFGIAKLLGDGTSLQQTLTARGQLLGTLSYMSPEQLDPTMAEIDARTDVYALGVMLYQMMSGRMPHGDTESGLIHALRAGDRAAPAPLPEAPKAMRRDLETIVQTALAHTPEMRYASAAHLADDVRRAMAGEPILARRLSPLARLAKLARRNPRTAALTGVGVAIILALAALNLAALVRLDRQVTQERDALAEMLDESVERIRRLSGALDSRRSLAESLLAQNERLLESRPRDPRLLEYRARILDELGDIAMAERDRERCRELRDRVVDAYAGLTERQPENLALARRYAEAIVKYGDLMAPALTLDGALPWYARAMVIHERLAASHADDAGVLDDLCWSYGRMSDLFWIADSGGDAMEYALRSDEIGQRLALRWPERALSHHAARGTALRLNSQLIHPDDGERAWETLVVALFHAEEAVRLEPDRLDFIHARFTVRARAVWLSMIAGRDSDAEQHAHSLLADAERLARDNRERRDLFPLPLSVRALLAQVYEAACRFDEMHAAARLGVRLTLAASSDPLVPHDLERYLCQLMDLHDRASEMVRSGQPAPTNAGR